MSPYVLDTDTFQLFQDGHPQVVARTLAITLDDLAISVVTVDEQLSGWYAQLRQAKRPERLAWAYGRLAAMVRFLAKIQIVDLDEPAIQPCALLRKRKLKIGKHKPTTCGYSRAE
jgi:tRNA(fMet)-specific endonuclease VapC